MTEMIAGNLRRFMEERSLSVSLLERMSDVSAHSIRGYVYGKNLPNLVNALKLSRAMGITLDELVEVRE